MIIVITMQGATGSPGENGYNGAKGDKVNIFVIIQLVIYLSHKAMHACIYCRQQEEPAILISRLLSHVSHVCSQHSFGLPLRMNGMHINAI